MARPDLGEKDILNPSEAIEYFVLSRRKFYDLLSNTDDDFNQCIAINSEESVVINNQYISCKNI